MSEEDEKLSYKDKYKHQFDFLMKAIDDTQNTIRFTDTKAAASVAFWGLIFTIIIRSLDDLKTMINNISTWPDIMICSIIAITMVFFFIQSFWLAYMVLAPKINPSEHIEKEGYSVPGLFFLHGMSLAVKGKSLYRNNPNIKLSMTTKEYIDRINVMSDDTLHHELILELQKISFIRNMKIARVHQAIRSILQFLISVFLGGIYLIGSKIFINHSWNISLDVSLNLTLLISLLLGHLFCKIIINLFPISSKKWGHSLRNTLVYTIILFMITFVFCGFFNWSALFVVFLMQLIFEKSRVIEELAIKLKMSKVKIKNKYLESSLRLVFQVIILFIVSLM
jgi:hypothetical protein